MPLYELFCMAKPALARTQASQLLRSAASAVLSKGGVLTDIKSYGERELAYEIRRPGMKLNEAFMWQLDFAAAPPVLRELEHLLKVDDRVVRYVILRRSAFKPLPNTYKVANKAKRTLQRTSS
ncbi:probable 30S ribosomal protein S6 [Coccomyxa sp. Obi]|nr:probable 30S ribosomal protein S6 [Coccomyxa sp. Obi]